jgi:response regulator RpfG family c-di-GMP phosphodiesterase
MLDYIFDDITTAVDGIDGLNKFNDNKYDLIISDINMPNLNGIKMLESIRKLDFKIPFIILSAHDNVNYFLESIDLGISGYILKPIDLGQLSSTMTKILKNMKYIKELEDKNKQAVVLYSEFETQMIEKVSEIYGLNQELLATQKEVIFTIGSIGEIRCRETANHVKRVALYSELLAKEYGLDNEECEIIKLASTMHDIGKVGIPDKILNKKGKHTFEEFEEMKTHSVLGYNMLVISNKPLLKAAATISLEHHEKYDGTGYPNGLSGEDIHIYGRIIALADVFDALGSNRVYKKAWDDDSIFKLFRDQKGKHFDPKFVDLFFDNVDKFLKIRNNHKD